MIDIGSLYKLFTSFSTVSALIATECVRRLQIITSYWWGPFIAELHSKSIWSLESERWYRLHTVYEQIKRISKQQQKQQPVWAHFRDDERSNWYQWVFVTKRELHYYALNAKIVNFWKPNLNRKRDSRELCVSCSGGSALLFSGQLGWPCSERMAMLNASLFLSISLAMSLFQKQCFCVARALRKVRTRGEGGCWAIVYQCAPSAAADAVWNWNRERERERKSTRTACVGEQTGCIKRFA